MEPRRSASSRSSKTDKTDKTEDEHIDPEDNISTPAEDNVDVEKNAEANATLPAKDGKEQERDAFLVKFEDGDRENPRNWHPYYKCFLTFQLGMLAMAGSLGSAIISPAEPDIAKDFNISTEVTVLCVSLYVLGFAFGPSLWAPISEVYGRKVSILPAVFVLSLFSIGSAVSQSAAALFMTRFFGGVFGSAPISNVSAALGDLYEPKARGIAVTFYAVAVVGGPTLGPTIAAAILVNPALNWRWTEYIEAIWVFTIFVFALLTMPEVFPLVILKRKAKRLRKETNDSRYWHPHESQKINLQNILTKHLSRPLRMLTTEPMVTAIAIYASFVYGLVYMTLELFPIVYRDERGWNTVDSTLPFLGLFVGVVAAVGVNLANQPRYIKAVEQNKGRAVPEARLPPMIVGGFILMTGIFWFGWTADPSIHWIAPTLATTFIGAGFNIVFQQCINFLVDSYGLYAASAVSANTILRSIMAAGLPLAAK